MPKPKTAAEIRRRRLKEVFVATEDHRSKSEDGAYVAFVQLAAHDYEVFKVFKRCPEYQVVLEHVSEDLGMKYLEVIEMNSPDFLKSFDAFQRNDLIGSPITFDYPKIGRVSPTTLRYVKVASDLRRLFGRTNFQQVAEIGVGYGGQLLICDSVFSFNEYHLFDLPPVLDLVYRYLESHVLNGSYRLKTLNQTTGQDHYDLAISNFAFSELPAALQRKYVEKILSKAERGYLTMNSGPPDSICEGDSMTLQELKCHLPHFEVLPEEPNSYPSNFLIIWGPEINASRTA